jgi:hypothetical protein
MNMARQFEITDRLPAVLTSLFMYLRPDLDATHVGGAVKKIASALIETEDETRLWLLIGEAFEALEN